MILVEPNLKTRIMISVCEGVLQKYMVEGQNDVSWTDAHSWKRL